MNWCLWNTFPIVVIKLVVKDPSEKLKRRQLLPTPFKSHNVQKKEHDLQDELFNIQKEKDLQSKICIYMNTAVK